MKSYKKITNRKKTKKKENNYSLHKLIKKQISKKKINCNTVISKSYPKYSKFLGCGSNGCALDSCLDKKCKDKIVIKIAKFDEAFNIVKNYSYNLNHPNFIEITFLNNFNKYLDQNMTPHLIYYSGYFFCDENIKNYLISSTNNNKISIAEEFSDKINNKKYIIHFVERADDDLWSYLNNNKLTFDIWSNIFFQICYTLTLIQYYNPGFRHNDLKPDNILINLYNSEPNTYNEYIIFDQKFYLPDIGIKVKLWDFDFSNSNKYKNEKVVDTWCRYLGINTENNPIYDIHFLLNNIFTYFINDKFIHDKISYKNLYKFFYNYLQTKDNKLLSMFNLNKINLFGYGHDGDDLGPMNNIEINELINQQIPQNGLINSFRLVNRIDGRSNVIPNDMSSAGDMLIDSKTNLFKKYLSKKNKSKIITTYNSKIKLSNEIFLRKDIFNLKISS